METTTALAFVISEADVSKKIDEIRSQYDRAFKRWPPHVNFIFPFTHIDNFDHIESLLRTAFNEGKLEPFDVFFNSIGFFSQGKGNVTLHLKPDQRSEVRLGKIFELIKEALPNIKIKNKDFHPHLTIGQCHKNDLPDRLNELTKWLNEGFVVRFESISFLHRSPETDDRMEIRKQLKLT